MKRQTHLTYSVLGLTAAVALLFAAGCGKQETPASDTSKAPTPAASEKPAAEPAQPAAATTPPPAPAATPAAPAAPDAAAAQSAAAATAQQAVAAAATQATAAASAATNQAQALIEKAKGLVTDEKYKDALNVLQQLSSLQLTPEQQKLVDSLKAQIQTALAKTGASDALNNILGGKK